MNVREYYLENGHEMVAPIERYLFDLFSETHGLPENLTTVCWFHSTRTTESNMFIEGILPLGDSLPLVWDMLIDNAPSKQVSDDLSELRSSGKMGSAFNGKIAKPIDAGPFATLVKKH